MKARRRLRSSAARRAVMVTALLGAWGTVSGCRSRTYVLATVDVDGEVQGTIAELAFTSSLVRGGSVVATDDGQFSGDGPLTFPRSFVLLADDRGNDGETVTLAVEAKDASGTVIARGESVATTIVAGEETTLSLTLRPACSAQDDCLGGMAFCDNPHICTNGHCERQVLEDDNSCTVDDCNEAERTATHDALPDGTECVSASGETTHCAQGICKSSTCGDFIVDVGEDCDDGPYTNSDTEANACRTNCGFPRCGDGIVDTAFGEACDEGADNVIVKDGDVATEGQAPDEHCRQLVTTDNGNGQDRFCVQPFCGDGLINGSERCDDHNQRAGDGCNPTCTLMGEVTTLAGSPGGAGHRDGMGAEARVANLLDVVARGGFAYFTADGLAGNGADNTIRRLDLATGEVTTLAGGEAGSVDGPGDKAQFNRPRGLALDGNTLYVADSSNHEIRSVDLAASTVTTVAGTGVAGRSDGPVATAQLNQPNFLALRSPGKLLVFDPGTCQIRQIDLTAGQVTTVAGTGCLPFGNNLGKISGMAMGPEPSLFVSDGSTIRTVNLDDGTITTLAGSPTQAGSTDGAVSDARFSQPAHLARDGDSLYVADLGNDVIRKIDLSASTVSTITPSPAVDEPRALALAGTTLVLGDRINHVIWQGTLDGTGILDLLPAAGIVSPASGESLPSPVGITMVPALPGSLYVAEGNGGTVDRVDLASGQVSELLALDLTTTAADVAATDNHLLVLGLPSNAITISDLTLSEAGTIASVAAPAEVAGASQHSGLALLDANAYVTDFSRQQIVRAPVANLAGATVIVGQSVGAPAIVDGPFSRARFIAPVGAVACAGKVYVSESTGQIGGHVIRELDLDKGVVSTVAGFPTSAGYQDAANGSETSLFNNPIDLACDERDPENPILYVVDQENQVIRQIDLSIGRVTTLAGIAGNAGSVDGVGIGAGFSSPRGIYFDPVSGDLFIADLGEGLIRRIH